MGVSRPSSHSSRIRTSDPQRVRVRILVDAGFSDLPRSSLRVVRRRQRQRSGVRLKGARELLADALAELA